MGFINQLTTGGPHIVDVLFEVVNKWYLDNGMTKKDTLGPDDH